LLQRHDIHISRFISSTNKIRKKGGTNNQHKHKSITQQNRKREKQIKNPNSPSIWDLGFNIGGFVGTMKGLVKKRTMMKSDWGEERWRRRVGRNGEVKRREEQWSCRLMGYETVVLRRWFMGFVGTNDEVKRVLWFCDGGSELTVVCGGRIWRWKRRKWKVKNFSAKVSTSSFKMKKLSVLFFNRNPNNSAFEEVLS
jgi:hypothetical protein